MIKLGMIGAGLFARDAHAPALKNLSDQFDVVGVYSRTEESASALAGLFPNSPHVYTDMDQLLEDENIEAVNITLPIHLLPTAVEKAVRAGKHVISEKPVAPSVERGQALLETVRSLPDITWMVAENWRYDNTILQAAELLRSGAIGEPYVFHWAIHVTMDATNPYYHTGWRRDNSFDGGFILDGGVHHISALRTIFGNVSSVCAHIRQVRADLPPVDTLAASFEFESGLIGTYTITYAVGVDRKTYLHIIGSEGELQMQPGDLRLIKDGDVVVQDVLRTNSVQSELQAFANAIQRKEQPRSTPKEALQDVAVVEALLTSGRTGKHVTPVRIV